MTDTTTTCPTAEQLRALLDESLPDSEQLELQNHVDGCEACQKHLETLVAGTESWDAAVGHLHDESLFPEGPSLSEVVQRIKEDNFAEAGSPPVDSARPLDFLEPSDQPGSIGRLGVYEVSEIIGQGGMGVVLKAYDPALHRVVAVKVLAPYLAHNPQARRRFVREAQAIAAVSHDHVIAIHAIDESAEQPKIVMQFVAGRSLQDRLDATGSLDLKEILRIGMQTASGLAAAHAQGLVHRDVKPSNILLENGIQRVKLTDFGLARAVDDASLTQSGVIAGTPQYMAPEQANGDVVDFRADLFSLGSVMYAMCVGHSPFRASTTMGVLKRVCHDPPRPIQELNPDIPDWLCDIIMKSLAKSPADRFQSARQIAELLEEWLAHVQQPNIVPKPCLVSEPSIMATKAESALRKLGLLGICWSIIGFCMLDAFVLYDLIYKRIGLPGLIPFSGILVGCPLAVMIYLKYVRMTYSQRERYSGSKYHEIKRSSMFLSNIQFDRTMPKEKSDFRLASAANIDKQSIFFQPISGRLLLILMLAGMAGSMAIASTGGMQINSMGGDLPVGELLMIGLIGGLAFGFWGLLFISLVRFLWTNLESTYQWTRQTNQFNSETSSGGSSSRQSGTISFLTPGNTAILAAIGAMIFHASPLEAAIIAVVVWRVAIFRASPRLSDGDNSTKSSESSVAEDASQSTTSRWRAIGYRLRHVLQFNTVMAIAWCIVGGMNLLNSSLKFQQVLNGPPIFMTLMSSVVTTFCIGLISIAAAHSVFVRQNFDLVRIASILGLFTYSVGTIVQIPLSMATLLWMHRPEARKSFLGSSWTESKLIRFFWRVAGGPTHPRFAKLVGWIAVWSIACLIVTGGFFSHYLIQMAPSEYLVNDDSAKNVVSDDGELSFGIQATGSGNANGLISQLIPYRCNSVTLFSADKRIVIKLRLGTPVTIESSGPTQKLEQGTIEAFFRKLSRDDHPEHAASLFRTLERFQSAQDVRIRSGPQSAGYFLSSFGMFQSAQTLYEQYTGMRRGYVPYVEMSSLIESTFFEGKRDFFVNIDVQPASWLVPTFCYSILAIWVAGIASIIFMRQRSREPVVVATSLPINHAENIS